MTEEEEQPQRRRRSSERSNDEGSIGRGSLSTLSSPSASPRRSSNRKSKESPLLEQRRVSEEALEQGIASLKSQYGHRHVSVAYMQASDHSGAVLTISGENSPVLDRSRPRGGLRGGSPGHRNRRRHSSMKQTKSSVLASPKTTMRSLSDSGSRSSPVLPVARRHHHHHHHNQHHRGHHSQPTSKTALLSSNTTSVHVDKDRARLADHIQMENNDDDDDEEQHRSRNRRHKSTRKRAIELAFAGCVMLLGVGALLVAFMWSGDTAWTIVGSTCMSLGALFLILGVCWYLSKAREGDQVEKLEIRVVNSNQMAQLIKQGFKVKPISAV